MKCYNGNSVRLRIIFVCIKKYQQSFLAPLLGNGCHIFFKASSSLYLYLFFLYEKHKKTFTMKPTPNPTLSASKGEFPKRPSIPKISSGYELRPGLIAMVWAQPFSGLENENLCNHLLEFEEICSILSISGMTQETLKWKLFPFSLTGKA